MEKKYLYQDISFLNPRRFYIIAKLTSFKTNTIIHLISFAGALLLKLH